MLSREAGVTQARRVLTTAADGAKNLCVIFAFVAI